MNLSKHVKLVPAITPDEGVAGTADIEGAVIDRQGFEGVLIEVVFGAITAGAVTSIKAQQGEAANLSDAADLEGTGQDVADDDDNKTFFIDVYKPEERYLRLYVDRATQDAVVASATYWLYEPTVKPTTHGTGVSGELHVSPAEGAA
jgi:hypothetical protein